jgi:hypothetical protein
MYNYSEGGLDPLVTIYLGMSMDEKIIRKLLTDFEILEDSKEPGEAFASINLNPSVTWAKFVLTDDLPNANKQRVPSQEFDNLIKTGVYMPIKMAEGQISEGHAGAFPIGVISHLKKANNQVLGLAALWNKERPEDVDIIKKTKNLQLSWEILYSESSKSEDGVEDLLGTALKGVTLVGMPAYQGRTPILTVAEKKNTEDKNMELEEKVKELEKDIVKKDEELESLRAIKAESAGILEELETLRAFKSEVEAKQARAEKLGSIRAKFKEAEIEKDEEYFKNHEEMLLNLEEAELDFFIQELVAFAKASDKKEEDKEDGESNSSTKIPPVDGTKPTKINPVELGKMLRERGK